MRLSRKPVTLITVGIVVLLLAFGIAFAASHFVQVSQTKTGEHRLQGFMVLDPSKIGITMDAAGDVPADVISFVIWQTQDPIRRFEVVSDPTVWVWNLTNEPVNLRLVEPCGDVYLRAAQAPSHGSEASALEGPEPFGWVNAKMWDSDGNFMGWTCDDWWPGTSVLDPGEGWKVTLSL